MPKKDVKLVNQDLDVVAQITEADIAHALAVAQSISPILYGLLTAELDEEDVSVE